VVEQAIFEYGAAEGPADERSHHRLSQCRTPLSLYQSAKDSGHYSRFNVSADTRDYLSFYDDNRTQAFAEDFYAEPIAMFGFTFDEDVRPPAAIKGLRCCGIGSHIG